MKLVTTLEFETRAQKFFWETKFVQEDGEHETILMAVQGLPFALEDKESFSNTFENVYVRSMKELIRDPRFRSLILPTNRS